ncbi:MAG: hypothetical protein ABW149_14650 [Sedimenticola sp.]
MAEINQPSHIKPIWPSRPEEGLKRRKRRAPEEKDDKDSQRGVGERERDIDSDDGNPHIDEYA